MRADSGLFMSFARFGLISMLVLCGMACSSEDDAVEVPPSRIDEPATVPDDVHDVEPALPPTSGNEDKTIRALRAAFDALADDVGACGAQHHDSAEYVELLLEMTVRADGTMDEVVVGVESGDGSAGLVECVRAVHQGYVVEGANVEQSVRKTYRFGTRDE